MRTAPNRSRASACRLPLRLRRCWSPRRLFWRSRRRATRLYCAFEGGLVDGAHQRDQRKILCCLLVDLEVAGVRVDVHKQIVALTKLIARVVRLHAIEAPM